MASGKVHEEFNTKIGAVMLSPTLFISPTFFVVSYLGLLFATFYLSPDLDLSHSRPSRRWGIMNVLIWSVYRRFVCTSHRVHHSIVGLLFRSLFLLPMWYGLYSFNGTLCVIFLGGVVVGDMLHLILDGELKIF